MSEWWTYRLSNFLLFSPRTYYRLFELYNAAIWPAQIAAALLGAAILLCLVRPSHARSRAVAAILASCWLWIALEFQAARYATINWAGVHFARAFALEAALLLWSGALRGRLRLDPGPRPFRSAGLWIFLFAFLVLPLIGPLLGRSWRQMELFGVAPDPTALATLGVLALAAGRRWHLIVIPAIWCAISGATLLAMDAPDAWVLPLAAAFAILFSFKRLRPAPAPSPSLSGRASQ
jgi:hypothetical protein